MPSDGKCPCPTTPLALLTSVQATRLSLEYSEVVLHTYPYDRTAQATARILGISAGVVKPSDTTPSET